MNANGSGARGSCVVCVWACSSDSATGQPSSAAQLTPSVTSSSHVTSAVSTQRVMTSEEGERVVDPSDIMASVFIGALLFIPVTVILCATAVIRLRRSGTYTDCANCRLMSHASAPKCMTLNDL